ncbi:hypothetical protein HLY00_4522 [Mycolicibacterium hippocampi]|uniref:histidine kinase n=2 Tax=Mycobacteriaceae TaxID=1762 RepID=A0A850PXR1_9MYCO|nr:hypothetical protein [Mycolicibacterium hippocampi]
MCRTSLQCNLSTGQWAIQARRLRVRVTLLAMTARARPPTDFPTPLERVGGFSYRTDSDQWEWSDAVARMHGYEPGAVTPTTELILTHKHDEDRLAVAEIVERVRRGAAPFSSRHRIVDTAGHTHHVVVVGEHVHDDDGQVIGTTGFYIDISEVLESDLQQTVNEVVATIEVHRAVINQAIGVIMWTYGVSAERAFDVLAWRSKDTNTKLRELARQFLDDIKAAPPGDSARAKVDHLLLTAHTRTDLPHG